MSNYDDPFKLGIVKANLNGEGGYDTLVKKWGMSSSTPLKSREDNR